MLALLSDGVSQQSRLTIAARSKPVPDPSDQR